MPTIYLYIQCFIAKYIIYTPRRENVNVSGWIYGTTILFDSLQPTKKVTRLLITTLTRIHTHISKETVTKMGEKKRKSSSGTRCLPYPGRDDDPSASHSIPMPFFHKALCVLCRWAFRNFSFIHGSLTPNEGEKGGKRYTVENNRKLRVRKRRKTNGGKVEKNAWTTTGWWIGLVE